MSNKLKILVVEDEEAISNFIATTLKANDYNVIMARTGKEALSMIPSHCPDVILLDLGLPDIDGIDYQILIEADYIVNASESGYSPENRKNFLEEHMKTESGKRLLRSTFCMET